MDLARTLTVAVSKDGEWYVARCLEVEVTSQGESVDDALAALREALELYFEDDEVPASGRPRRHRPSASRPRSGGRPARFSDRPA